LLLCRVHELAQTRQAGTDHFIDKAEPVSINGLNRMLASL
jgi:hypothetical protein